MLIRLTRTSDSRPVGVFRASCGEAVLASPIFAFVLSLGIKHTKLRPQLPIQRAELNGLGNVFAGDGFGGDQVGDGAGNF